MTYIYTGIHTDKHTGQTKDTIHSSSRSLQLSGGGPRCRSIYVRPKVHSQKIQNTCVVYVGTRVVVAARSHFTRLISRD